MKQRSFAWESIKSMLNNLSLLKWIRKFSADNLLDDNVLAEGYNIRCNDQSISIGDTTMTKLLVTQARYGGKEYARFNFKQLKSVFDALGSEGELIVSADNNKEIFVQIKDTVVVVSPLPKSDKKKEK